MNVAAQNIDYMFLVWRTAPDLMASPRMIVAGKSFLLLNKSKKRKGDSIVCLKKSQLLNHRHDPEQYIKIVKMCRLLNIGHL